MNQSEIEALFAQALSSDSDQHDPWPAIRELQRSGSRDVFDFAAKWIHSSSSRERECAANVLGQLAGHYEPSSALIMESLQREEDPTVVDAALHALGHLGNPDTIPWILRHKNHPNSDVRYALAFACGSLPNDPRTIDCLIQLTRDADPEIRDWSVFGLGVLGDSDSPQIRETLLRCLDDPDEDVREEAAVGLAKRRDQRVWPKLKAMLHYAKDDDHPRLREALELLG